MTFPTGGTAAAFLAFALVITVGAQALAQTPAQTPVQTPTEATPLSADNEFYALRGPAEAGDAQAQFALANHYFDGRGAAQDYGQAVTWYLYKSALRYYHLAANKGYAQAEYNLGAMYQSGLGVKRDDKQAFEWFRKAADQNHPEAENEVGYSYRCGCGVGRDYAQALNWYRRAADHGNSNAETNLGFMAEKGWGQPQSYDEAFSWYYKAADHGNAGAMDNIGFNFQNGVGVAVDFAKAWSWLYRAALLGSGSAENQIGWMYRHGQGVTQDDAIAVWWYRLADAQGISDADLNLRDVCNDHEQRGDELCDLAVPVHDLALELVQRRTTIKDLRAKIASLETDALQDDMHANHLANIGTDSPHAKDNVVGRGLTKFFDALGRAAGTPSRLLAPKAREDAARLREQLAQLESLEQSAANVPAP